MIRSFSPRVIARGEGYLEAIDAAIDRCGGVVGSVQGSRENPYDIRMRPSAEDARVLVAACSCPAAEEGACKHLWAMLRVIDREDAWPREVSVPTKLVVTDVDDRDLDLIIENEAVEFCNPGTSVSARATRDLGKPRAPKVPSWRDRMDPWPHSASLPAQKPANVEYIVDVRAMATLTSARRSAFPQLDERGCTLLLATTTQTKATRTRPSRTRRTFGRVDSSRLSPVDVEIHQVLFGIEELSAHGWSYSSRFYYSPQARSGVRIAAERVADVLSRLSATGRLGWLPDPESGLAPLGWDEQGTWILEVSMEAVAEHRVRATGCLVRGDERIPLDDIAAVGGGGVAIFGTRLLHVATEGSSSAGVIGPCFACHSATNSRTACRRSSAVAASSSHADTLRPARSAAARTSSHSAGSIETLSLSTATGRA
ncbi:MAG TPA: hypothetical protein VFV99_16045 [Kofleriaceae bacterium]|nr:hypothetical protein [Kofleriaceae bacterium]